MARKLKSTKQAEEDAAAQSDDIKKKVVYGGFDPSKRSEGEWIRRKEYIFSHTEYCWHCKNILKAAKPQYNEFGIWKFYRIAGIGCLYFLCNEILKFSKMLPETHYKFCEFIQQWNESVKEQQLKINVMPRGSFKSSISTVGNSIQDVIKNPDISLLICMDTLSNAIVKLAEIKMHFILNDRLREFYGNYYPPIKDPNRIWRESSMRVYKPDYQYKLTGEANITCSGVDSPKVSRHFQKVKLDDLHNHLNCLTTQQIDKIWNCIQSYFAILDPDGKMEMTCTPWNEFDALSRFKKLVPKQNIFWQNAYKEDGSLFFPTVLNEKFLEEQKRRLGSYRFSLWYLCHPSASEAQKFKQEWFKSYLAAPLNLEIATAIDPASGEGKDSTAIVTVGYDRKSTHIYVLEVKIGKWNEPQTAFELAETCNRLFPRKVGMEAVALGTTYRHNVAREFNRNNWRIPGGEILPLTSSSRIDKKSRICSMVSLYQEGAVWHKGDDGTRKLEEQLLWFRIETDANPDDAIDALERAITLVNPTRKADAIAMPTSNQNPSWGNSTGKSAKNSLPAILSPDEFDKIAANQKWGKRFTRKRLNPRDFNRLLPDTPTPYLDKLPNW